MVEKIKGKLNNWFKDRSGLKRLLCNLGFWLLSVLYFELLAHVMAFGAPNIRFGFVVGFSLFFALIVVAVTSVIPKKYNFIVTLILNLVFMVLYGSQMVYYFIFDTFYSVSQMQMGGEALANFWKEMFMTMKDNILWVLALLVPTAALCLLRRFAKTVFEPGNWLWSGMALVLAVAVHFGTVACLPIGGTGNFTSYDFYYSNTTTTDQALQQFGLLTAFRLSFFSTGAPAEESGEGYYTPIPDMTLPEKTEEETDKTEGTENSTSQEEAEPVVTYNVLDFDFDELNSMTNSEKIIAINNYCSQMTGTNKNEYTGMLKDYNLITLTAESFSPAAIDPVLTPTLYRLANEGIVFNNYYTTFPSNTSDGEYTLCMGLYPDGTRDKKASSFFASRNSYLPYCLGNMFGQQLGVQSHGYHNYSGSYYGRNQSHPNMGYSMQFANSGMKFSTRWPSSDLEMMEQSVDDYIGQEQFHAYYMTFSGHLYYDRSVNPMAARNWNQVKDLDYSNAGRCYLSCHIELEKALTYLMERLEEEGVADRTAIVLAADHEPYGLTDSQYSELVGFEADRFGQAKSNLIFWVGGLEENIIVDEYCSSADVLPTILNLWGFDYDSRMLAGTDVFSDGPHIAVLNDKSFLTDKVWVDASSGKITYLVDESELPEGYVDNLIALVKTKFTLSADILNTAYYNFIFEKGKVTLNRLSWAPTEKPKASPSPSVSPSPSPSVMPSPTAVPTAAPSTTESPSPAPGPSDRPTTAPTATPEATGSPSPSPEASATPTTTPVPTGTPAPTPTPAPTESPKPTDAPTAAPTESPTVAPTETQKPDTTKEPEDKPEK